MPVIKNSPELERFNKRLVRQEKISYRKALRIFGSLYKEAVSLRIFRHENILDGLDTDLKIAKILNALF